MVGRCCPLLVALLVALSWQPQTEGTVAKDQHGGIPMDSQSVPNCDDAKTHLDRDWDGDEREYLCSEPNMYPVVSGVEPLTECLDKKDIPQPLHFCMDKDITYQDTPPRGGSHRPVWPTYGEYAYIPPQRWLHSVEHGAAVFLYHPCASRKELDTFKALARSCLRRYIITPYRLLPKEWPFTIITWGCRLRLNDINNSQDVITDYLQTHAIRAGGAPEGAVSKDGAYNYALLRQSDVVSMSDWSDSKVCPNARRAKMVNFFEDRQKTRSNPFNFP